MAETGVIVMVALLTLRTQALLSSTIQGAGHMRVISPVGMAIME